MLLYESYEEHEKHLPSHGKFIIAHHNHDSIVVYQAFKDSIASYAVQNQKFGGPDYDFERMTWLKPSFFWMMYYSGWAKKENQENVLAIRMSRHGFDQILKHAVMATFYKDLYKNDKIWKDKLEKTDIHLDWEPYHDLYGNKTERKAVKIGLQGEMLQQYNNEWIEEIQNITPYVREQQQLITDRRIKDLQVPKERAYAPDDLTILTKIDATTISL
jgi:hypothetical protein